MQLADQGRLAEAEECYERCLRQSGPSADLLYLLGLVRDASGRQAEAVQLYRKALYLDPRHRDALLHLALLLDTQNKPAEADVLRRRADRLTGTAEART
jgi:chemotaxis protein methyltransferase WspC